MKQLLTSVIVIISAISAGYSQSEVHHGCATDEYNNELLKEIGQAAQHQLYLRHLTDLAENPPASSLEKKKAVKTIPVVFHVIHQYGDENISKEQILDQLRVLNEDFSRTNEDRSSTRQMFQARSTDMEIEFKLAKIDPGGKCTDGITRTYSTLTDGGDDLVKNIIRWDTRKYLNIWVIKRIYYGGGTNLTLGYATFPYNSVESKDGIVIRADRVGTIGTAVQNSKGRVLTHEVGHYLGLYHTFQGGCGSSCSNTGDRICDTPPVKDPSYGCPLSNNTCSNDSPDEMDMIENYMDYSNGNCMNAFTSGQKVVVTSVMNNYRQILWSSPNLAATGVDATTTCKPIADFRISENLQRVCVGATFNLEDLSWNGDVTDYEWSIPGGTPQVSTFPSPTVSFSQPGRYSIKLKVSNSAGFDTLTKEEIIQVVPLTAEHKTPFKESFENKTEFERDWILTDEIFGWRHSNYHYDGGKGGLQAYINNETPDGQDFYIQLPPVDMSAFAGLDPSISFRVAYALPQNGVNGEFLYLEGSTDCGATWKNVFVWLGRTTLKSTSLAKRNWVPLLNEDWHVLSVKLDKNGFESSKNLILRFRARSGSGNSIFIDDVNIDRYSLSVDDDNDWAERMSIFPNPSNGSFNISFQEGSDINSVTLTDQLGRVVRSVNITGTNSNGIQMDHLNPGMYIITVTATNGNSHMKKIIITNTQ